MKNLVMGVAKGYGWNDVEPFVNSFKKNCPNTDLVLFVDDLSAFTEKIFKSVKSLTLIPFPEKFKNNIVDPLQSGFVTNRFSMYKDFLVNHSEYKNVLLTDVRDVIFQGDIFSIHKDKNFILCAMENAIIKNEVNNSKWIKNMFGEDEYKKIMDKDIICAGTILGSRNEMITLLSKMIEIMSKTSLWGSDQATLNYMIHNKILPIKNIIKSSVQDGDIYTMGLVKTPKITKSGSIVRGDEKIPAVVHQYDRVPALINLVDDVHREKNFQPNEEFIDTRSALEQVACLAQVQKWQEATKYFMNSRKI